MTSLISLRDIRFRIHPFLPACSLYAIIETESSSKSSYKGGKGKGGYKGKKFEKKPEALTREDRKRLRKERRAAKPHAAVVEKANKLWSVSLSQEKKEDRLETIKSLLKDCEGNILNVSAKHDTSRVLQCAIKYGDNAQRQLILDEIKGQMTTLAMDKHAHHLILKLVQYCTPKQRETISEEFRTNVKKLSLQANSAKVLDYLYADGSNKIKTRILNEIYSREFALFEEDNSSNNKKGKKSQKGNKKLKTESKNNNNSNKLTGLAAMIEKHPSKKDSIKENLERYFEKALKKDMLMFRYTHALLKQYILNYMYPGIDASSHASSSAPSSMNTDTDTDSAEKPVTKEAVLEFISSLNKYAAALHHSVDGAWVVSFCLAFGSNKDKKAIIKCIKGFVVDWAENDSAFMIITRALDVVDDTVLLRKQIVNELITDDALERLHESPSGVKVFLHLLAPLTKGYFTQSEKATLFLPKWSDGSLVSKKHSTVRRMELLKLVLAPLVTFCIGRVSLLCRNVLGWKLVYETLRVANVLSQEESYSTNEDLVAVTESGYDLSKLQKEFAKLEGPTQNAFTAMAKLCENDDDTCLLSDFVGHRVIKRLMTNLKPNSNKFARTVAGSILKLGDGLAEQAQGNRAGFALEAVLSQCTDADDEIVNELKTSLKKGLKALKKGDKAGNKALVKALSK